MRLGAIVLAAGAATRMGSIKQLLPYKGLTLVEHAIVQAESASMEPIVVVLGAQAEEVGRAVAKTSAHFVINGHWQSGMGSSITTGLAHLLQLAPDVEAVAILLADQPFVTASQLRQMRRVFEGKHAPIVAASYAGTIGVPAIFSSTVFHQLQQLPPESGARALLRSSGHEQAAEITRFDLPEAATDIDTPDDFAAIQ